MPHPKLISLGLTPVPRPREGYSYADEQLFDPYQTVAWVFQMPESANIVSIGVAITDFAVSSPHTTTPKYKLVLRSVHADGTPDEATNHGEQVFSVPVGTPVPFFQFATFTGFAAQRGKFYTAQLEYDSEQIDFQNNIVVRSGIAGYEPIMINPHVLKRGFVEPYDSWSFSNRIYPTVAIRGIVGQTPRTYGTPAYRHTTLSTFDGTDPIAMRFKLPSGMGQGFRVSGLRIVASTLGAPLQKQLTLWRGGASPAVLQQNVISGLLFDAISTTAVYRGDLYFENPLVTLSYGTEYYIGFLQPINQEHTITIDCMEVPAAQDMSALPGGAEVYMVRYNSSTGQWDHFPTLRPSFDLILGDYPTISSSSSSSAVQAP